MAILSEEVRQKVEDTLKGLKEGLKLVVFTQEFECPTCEDNRILMEELSSIINKARVEVLDFVRDKEKAEKSGRVEFLSGYAVKEIRGEGKVESIVIRDIKGDKEVVLDVGGVFIEIGAIPNVEFAKDVVKFNELKEIEVDCDCKTSVAGVFAAGDVTNAPEKQIIVAAGEGAKAALSAYHYLVVS